MLHRLAENDLLSGDAVRTPATDVGDAFVWWLGRCSDGAFGRG